MYKHQKGIAFLATLTILFFITKTTSASGGVTTYQAEINNLGTSAVLHGFAPVGSTYERRAYFEWGETSAFGRQTQWRQVSRFFPSTSDISYPLSNLTPETKYYFRLVVLDPEMGVLYGETKNFTTPVVHVSLLGSALGLNTTAANGKTNATTQTTTNNSSASQGETNARQGTNSSSARSSLFAGLFGLGSTNNTTNSTNITSTEGVGSLLPISFLGWTALALLIFFITALLVYIANLYRRLKEVKKKRKEERKAVPANLPIM